MTTQQLSGLDEASQDQQAAALESLHSLLVVDPDHVTGLLDEYSPDFGPDDEDIQVPMRFFFVRFQGNQPRFGHLASLLCNHIVPFCLNRSEYESTSIDMQRKLLLTAKGKFANLSDNRSGEPGELLLYLLLEGVLGAPKILSKMSLKTNPQMPVHGSDAVHLGFEGNDIILYFGESKLYQDYSAAIRSAIDSVEGFMSSECSETLHPPTEFEISILVPNLDVQDGPLKERLLLALDPYTAERSSLRYVNCCLIGFDAEKLYSRCDEGSFRIEYEKRAQDCYKRIVSKI